MKDAWAKDEPNVHRNRGGICVRSPKGHFCFSFFAGFALLFAGAFCAYVSGRSHGSSGQRAGVFPARLACGSGAGAGISSLYYPQRERTWTKTGQKWVNQVALDGVFNFLKEFWPDIRHDILRQK
jgi:hypothetical protein